jgi:hypothetical protein
MMALNFNLNGYKMDVIETNIINAKFLLSKIGHSCLKIINDALHFSDIKQP